MLKQDRKLSSHRHDWLLPEANFESAETLLAINSTNAVYACKPYMLLKLCVCLLLAVLQLPTLHLFTYMPC